MIFWLLRLGKERMFMIKFSINIMKKRNIYIKRGIGIFLMIFGIFIITSEKVFTGAVIGISKVYYFGLIGFLMFLVGTFLSLEDIISGFRKRREEQGNQTFKHRLNMARVSQPIYYVFSGNQEYDEESFRKNLERTRGYGKITEKKSKKMLKGEISSINFAYYWPLMKKYGFSSHVKLPSYAHEFMHHLRRIGLVSNDYVIATAVDTYLKKANRYKPLEYQQEELDRLNEEEPRITKPENLRKLTRLEKLNPDIEYSKKKGFVETGASLGYYAAYLEGASKKPGVGLYFMKLVSDGVSPGKAKEMILGDYKPLKEFQEKYGKRWRRVLESTWLIILRK